MATSGKVLSTSIDTIPLTNGCGASITVEVQQRVSSSTKDCSVRYKFAWYNVASGLTITAAGKVTSSAGTTGAKYLPSLSSMESSGSRYSNYKDISGLNCYSDKDTTFTFEFSFIAEDGSGSAIYVGYATCYLTGNPWWEKDKEKLDTKTNPKINSSSSITVKYGTTYSVSWSTIQNAGSYNVYSVGETPGTYGYNFSVNPTKATSSPLSRGNWAKDAIGYYYRHYVQPIPKNSNTHVSPAAKDCGYVRVLVTGAVYLYDINGKILSNWNNKLATSWNSSQVSYSISGYNAVKWYTKPNGQGTEISNYSTAQFRSTGNLILYAYATKKQVTVTFDAQGGTCSPATKTVNVGTDLNLSTATTITSVPAGKSFKGWSKSVNGAIISGTINITSNIKLYAVWIDNYNIGYNLNPATLITGSTLTTSPPSISGGEKKNGVDFPIYGTTPTMQGHTFLHWKDSSGTTYPVGGVYTANTGTTLTAIWSSNTYNLTFATPSNGAPGPTITSATATFNQNYVLPPVPPHNAELWAPKNPFWLVQNGASAASYPVGGNLPMVYANDNTVITPQWTQITYWRGGWLWIYVPEEGGFN